jgi:hypothetical protein
MLVQQLLRIEPHALADTRTFAFVIGARCCGCRSGVSFVRRQHRSSRSSTRTCARSACQCQCMHRDALLVLAATATKHRRPRRRGATTAALRHTTRSIRATSHTQLGTQGVHLRLQRAHVALERLALRARSGQSIAEARSDGLYRRGKCRRSQWTSLATDELMQLLHIGRQKRRRLGRRHALRLHRERDRLLGRAAFLLCLLRVLLMHAVDTR